MIKGLVIGCFLAVVILAGGFFSYFASGMAPVATADPPMPFEKKLANMALDAHIEKQHDCSISGGRRRTHFSCRCGRLQTTLCGLSRSARPAAHRLRGDDVSKAD